MTVVLTAGDPALAADAGTTKTLIDYFLPTPIVCPLTSSTWGAAGVLPRDVCNGLEDSTNTQWQYWDGKILQGPDGRYHMYAGRWPQNKGFADWPQSVIVEGVSNGTLMGSYVPVSATPFSGKEQNVTGIALNSGGGLLIDSPGKVYTSTTLADPWTSLGTLQVDANGSTISSATTENQSIWQSADSSFLIISRTFQEMVSPSSPLGPYTIEATIPNLQSQGYEDPVVWCSGGQYHLVANMYNARKAMHFTSTDGIHNWVNKGLAYDPTTDFIRYTDGTVNHWYKVERPGVVMEGGHVTAFTFAVIDVDKSLDLANDTHGSKIIVVPFDGASFDRDNPGPGTAGCPLESGTGGAAGSAGASGGTGGRGGAGGGLGGSAGVAGKGGGSGGSGGESGATGTGGRLGTGGASGGQTGAGSGGAPGSGGASGGSGGSYGAGGSSSGGSSSGGSSTGGSTTVGDSTGGGCSCSAGGPQPGNSALVGVLSLLLAFGCAVARRRRARPREVLGSSPAGRFRLRKRRRDLSIRF